MISSILPLSYDAPLPWCANAGAATITQSAAITATGNVAGSLKVVASDNVTLQSTLNDILKVAANITAAGKFFKYTDANALTVSTVDSLTLHRHAGAEVSRSVVSKPEKRRG